MLLTLLYHHEHNLPRPTPPQGHVAAVRELLRDPGRRALLRAMAKDGSTALHAAAVGGQEEVARLLLEAGALADVRDRVSAVRGCCMRHTQPTACSLTMVLLQ